MWNVIQGPCLPKKAYAMPCIVDSQSYECDRCNSKFKTMTYLKVHINVHNRAQYATCKQCEKSVRNLKVHLCNHTGEKHLICSYCQKEFSQPSTLKNHIYLHTGEIPLNAINVIQKGNMKIHRMKFSSINLFRILFYFFIYPWKTLTEIYLIDGLITKKMWLIQKIEALNLC